MTALKKNNLAKVALGKQAKELRFLTSDVGYIKEKSDKIKRDNPLGPRRDGITKEYL